MTVLWVWVGGTASYLLLVGQVSFDEVAAGVAMGGMAAGWHAAVRRATRRRFAVERRAGTGLLRAVRDLPAATLRVALRLAAALVGRAEGRSVERMFHGGREDDAREAGRRAVVVLAQSLAPDSYVLRLPVSGDTILYHAITTHSPGHDPRWPS